MPQFSENQFLNFNEQDFINDPFFQDWIIHPTPETDLFWMNFLKTHPEKSQTIGAARYFLQNVHFEEEQLDDSYVHQLYLEHLRQVQSDKKRAVRWLNAKVIQRLVAVAAILVGVVLVISILFPANRGSLEKVMVATKFGEIKKVSLPDGTDIVLNAHSSVSFSKNWDGKKPREIWLNGEAFINVAHLNDGKGDIKPFERFLVYGEGFTIEVLGTSFDIRQRRGKTEVVLQTGKIKLTLKDSDSTIFMLPGDIVSYVPAEEKVVKSKTIPENYSGWKEKKLLLNNPTLEEIAHYLEDNYGKKIIIEDQKIRKKKIEGLIPLDNLNDALFIVSTVLNTNIEQKNSEILIRSK
ncbi:MAG TPA: FecR domain-containing protein [Segetibacter sp.]|nr:FecR domain-containing protein [Segetibacter sp.]